MPAAGIGGALGADAPVKRPVEAGNPMKLKTVTIDGKTYAEVQDDKPIYLDTDGKEVAFDAPGTRDKISQLNREAQGHREGKESVERALKAFEGMDAAKAREAIEKLGNIDAKKLIDAGEVETVKAEIAKSYQTQIDDLKNELASTKGQTADLRREYAFAGSKFVADKVAIPLPFLQKTYGSAFKEEDGKLVGYDANGQKIYSRANPGELASFDEALELLISADPYKDHILKGTTKPGGGAPNSGGGNGGGSKTITRADFNALSPDAQRAKVTTEGFTVVD